MYKRQIVNGLSLPRALLPTLEEIEERFVKNLKGDVIVDYSPEVRAKMYFEETNFPGVPDDRLGWCLQNLSYSPDLVLLDSAGYLGYIEFTYLIENLKSECIIALDDIQHVKHFESFKYIRKHPDRFEILEFSPKDKFGFCIARFLPPKRTRRRIKRVSAEKIVWVRTDSIGDNVLAASMLPYLYKKITSNIVVVCQDHIKELYEHCPFVEKVISFNKPAAYQNASYRNWIIEQIRAYEPDLALNSVFSREPITDVLTLQSGAKEKIAMYGDLCNIPQSIRDENNKHYTQLIASKGEWKLELDRHKDFLKGLGITVRRELQPVMWLSSEDVQRAKDLFQVLKLEPKKTIALFAGAQSPLRIYKLYGHVLRTLCEKYGFGVIALGARHDHGVNESQLKGIDAKYVNLSGKTTLRQCAAIIKLCALALGAETGLAHMACAVGTPNVIMLGGGHFGRFMPYSPLTTAVILPLDCYGCNWRCKYGRGICVQEIAPEVVEKAVEDTLKHKAGKPRVFVQTERTWSQVRADRPVLPKWALPKGFVDFKKIIWVHI